MPDFLRFEAAIDLSGLSDKPIERRAALSTWLREIAGMVDCDSYAGVRYAGSAGDNPSIGRWSVDGRRCASGR